MRLLLAAAALALLALPLASRAEEDATVDELQERRAARCVVESCGG